jgi:hypothetical protein
MCFLFHCFISLDGINRGFSAQLGFIFLFARAGFHQNGGGPPRAVSPMSVDGGPASKPSLSAAGGRGGGGGNEGRGSPSPSLVSEKTLTEAELQVSLYIRVMKLQVISDSRIQISHKH